MAAAIKAFADYSRHEHPIAVVTGYFDLGGYEAIEDVLGAAPAVRILLGTEPKPLLRRVWLPGDPEDPLTEALGEGEKLLFADRDFLPFTERAHGTLGRFLVFLGRAEVEVRRYTRGFLHGKAFVFGDEAGALAGSANFTRKGLTENLELELGQYGPEEVRRVRKWFDDLWVEAEEYDLAAVYSGRNLEFDPYTVYLRTLLEVCGDPFEGAQRDALPGFERIELAEFQRLGVQRALRVLEQWNGVLLADGVGLGKTFMAGDIITHFVRGLGQRVLLIVPASLRDHAWAEFLARFGLAVEVVSFQELASDRQVGEPPVPGEEDRRRSHLRLPVEDYRLVVVDEAHTLRNPDTQYYRALRRLMAAGNVDRKLVLLTATPVNNSLWDLYYQIMLFARHDAAFARLGIPGLRDFFKAAMGMDLSEHAPRHLFPLIDAVSVRRTRSHIQRFYPDATLNTPDGPRAIRFPVPRLIPVAYSLEGVLPGFFDEVAEAIRDELTMARYQTDSYRVETCLAASGSAGPSGDARTTVAPASQQVLVGLLRSQLLKRFESSVHAFRRTLEKMIDSHELFLELLDRGYVPDPGGDFEDLARDPDDDTFMELLGETAGVSAASGYDVAALRHDVEADQGRLRALLTRAGELSPTDDPKLGALWDTLDKCADRGEGDERKVIVFSYFADTVEYIARELAKTEHPALEVYRRRFAAVAGSGVLREAPHHVEPQEAVFGFAPVSSNAPPGSDDRYDLLVATDVLAEGQNLQQAAILVNFDLPWNPMRLAQRNGRIDRLNSEHEEVHLYCFFPASELDALLDLEATLRAKIAQANASVGIDSPILPGVAGVARDFTDTRRHIETIVKGDAGILDELDQEADLLTGELFRDELRRGLMEERFRELRALPWGIGSGIRKEGPTGAVFAARVGRNPHLRFVPLGDPAVPDGHLLTCLQRVRCQAGTERYLPDAFQSQLFTLWERARGDILAYCRQLRDPAANAATLPKAQQDALALLRRVDVEGTEQAINALLVPWSPLITRKIRGILRLIDEGVARNEVALRIIQLTRDEGLRGTTALELPPAVAEDDILLVCYQAVGL